MDYVYVTTHLYSTDYEIPKSGWYRFHVVGMGGTGGSGASAYVGREHADSWVQGGSGGAGGSGAYVIHDQYLNKGQVVQITVNSAKTEAFVGGTYLLANAGTNGGNGTRISSSSANKVYYGTNGTGGAGGVAMGGNVLTRNGVNGGDGSGSYGGTANSLYSALAKYTPQLAATGGKVVTSSESYRGGKGGAGGSAISNSLNLGAGGAGGGGASVLVTTQEGKDKIYSRSYTGGSGGTGGAGGVVVECVANTPPTTPGGIRYTKPVAGGTMQAEWDSSFDEEGHSIHYVLEGRVDDEPFGEYATTSSTWYSVSVPKYGETFQLRVKAVDSEGGESEYREGAALTVVYTKPPVISGEDENLGLLDAPPCYTYSVSKEPDTESLTITETLSCESGDYVIRSFPAKSGDIFTADLSGYWLYATNAYSYLVITAEDADGAKDTRVISFLRESIRVAAQRTFETAGLVDNCLIVFEGDKPDRCELCNNPFDDRPVWEDATGLVNEERHYFENKGIQRQPGFGFRFVCNSKGDYISSRVESVSINIELTGG